jgi:hypothetical protein
LRIGVLEHLPAGRIGPLGESRQEAIGKSVERLTGDEAGEECVDRGLELGLSPTPPRGEIGQEAARV